MQVSTTIRTIFLSVLAIVFYIFAYPETSSRDRHFDISVVLTYY